MSATVHISSASQWQSILNSSTVVIADCKMLVKPHSQPPKAPC